MSKFSRLRQITAVVAKHGLSHYAEQRRAAKQQATLNSAFRFRAVLEELGPTFVKFGQVLSTRADLLPKGFSEVLAELQDHCSPMTYAEVKQVIEEGLGKPMDACFSSFEQTPVACASIAQVHRAVTLDHKEVAVKVQRLNARENIEKDLELLRILARLLENIVEETGVVTPRGIVDEFEQALLAEVDFKLEAQTIQRFYANLKERDSVCYVVPKVYHALSCETVLTMDFMHGKRLTDLDKPKDKRQVVENIVRSAFDQVFIDGLFHADPHPGNLFVLEDNSLALIDFGSVGQISFAMRETLVVMVIAINMRDADAVARLLYRVGIPQERVLLHQLRDAVASLFDNYLRERENLFITKPTQLLGELFDLAARFKIKVPSEYALIARAGLTLEGIVRQLDPQLEVLEMLKPMIKKLIDERFSLPELGDRALSNLLLARDMLKELPMMASQILMDLEAGKTRIQIEAPRLDTIARNIDTLGITVFMGFMAFGLIVGAFYVLASSPLVWHGIFVAPSIAIFLASILFGGVMGRYMLAGRLRKFSLFRLGRKRR